MQDRVVLLHVFAGEELAGRVFVRVLEDRSSARLSKIEPRDEGAAWPGDLRRLLADRRLAERVSGLEGSSFEPGTFPVELLGEAGRRLERATPGLRVVAEPGDWEGGPGGPEPGEGGPIVR